MARRANRIPILSLEDEYDSKIERRKTKANKGREINATKGVKTPESSFATLDPNFVKEFTLEDEENVESDLKAVLDSFRIQSRGLSQSFSR